MSNFQQLQVWQKSIDLVTQIYSATEKFPSNERFGLISQMRRAAVSIPSNITEGCERKTRNDFANFIIYARSSAAELETQLFIAYKLKYLQEFDLKLLNNNVVEIKRMLAALRRKILGTRNSELTT